MRGWPSQLGVGAMSLYTYVPGKAELFELMIDRAYGERAWPTRGSAGGALGRALAGQALAMYRRHPWLVHTNLWRLPLGPHVLDVNEEMTARSRRPACRLQRVRVASEPDRPDIFGIARSEMRTARSPAHRE